MGDYDSRTRVTFRIPKGYPETIRRRIGREIVRRIRQRTESGIDKNGAQFKGYSEAYQQSLDFRIAGKSPGQVNLKLSGDMMTALEVIDTADGFVTVGITDAEDQAKAHGHLTGAEGRLPIRDFLGLPEGDLKNIVERFPVETSTERAQRTQDLLSQLLGREDVSQEEASRILAESLRIGIEDQTVEPGGT